MIRITPLVSTDIIGRYVKAKNGVVDHFTNELIPASSKRMQSKILKKLNTVGLINSERLQKGLALRTIAVA